MHVVPLSEDTAKIVSNRWHAFVTKNLDDSGRYRDTVRLEIFEAGPDGTLSDIAVLAVNGITETAATNTLKLLGDNQPPVTWIVLTALCQAITVNPTTTSTL